MDTHDPIPDVLMKKIRIMSECEEVLEIPGFSHYAVTITGQVWSVKPRGVQRVLPKIPRRMKTQWYKGFELVKLKDDQSHQHTWSIGRILLTSFVEPAPFENAQASFIDGNPSNMALDNLKWVTNSERVIHSVERNGGAFVYGEAQGGSKLKADEVDEMRNEYLGGATFQQIADRHGVTRRTAARAVRGTAWKQIDGGIVPELTNHKKGEAVNLAKLDEGAVRDIRRLLDEGYTLRSIAEQTGMGTSAIHSIKVRRTWKHVK